MKVVIDNAIPYVKGILEPFADVVYRGGSNFSSEEVADADVLIIRTRTRCNEALLRGSKVKMIATATIGFDHIDLDYCRRHDIKVVTAAGSNAAGVLQWVAAALAMLLTQKQTHGRFLLLTSSNVNLIRAEERMMRGNNQ